MILVDTSVWIQHFRVGEPVLQDLLIEGKVLMHPFVLGELACGNLKNRESTMRYLDELPDATAANHNETMYVLELQQLWGRGIGWIDAHLLASALLTNCEFWTRDTRLEQAAALAGVKSYRA